MSETQHSGCGLWAIIVMLVLAATGIIFQEVIPALHSVLPLHVEVTIPPAEAGLPFTLQDGQIVYTYEPLPLNPCNQIIQGRIFDSDGQVVSNVRVNVQIHEFYILTPTPPLSFDPAWRVDSSDPSLWVLVMATDQVLYSVWLTDEYGEKISPTIIIPPQDCNHNVATVIFTQNLSSS